MKNKSVFQEIENQNRSVAQAFRELRAQSNQVASGASLNHGMASSPLMTRSKLVLNAYYPIGRDIIQSHRVVQIVARLLVACGLIAAGLVFGPPIYRWLVQYWKHIVLIVGAISFGIGLVLLVGRIGTSPLRTIEAPDTKAADPLRELKGLAERAAVRLRAAYRLQISMAVAVGVVFVSLTAWSAVMVSQDRLAYACAFGSGGVAMMILTQWKWQPFERINEARRLADNADTLATGLRLRMETISQIQDPTERAKAQWQAVSDYLARSE